VINTSTRRWPEQPAAGGGWQQTRVLTINVLLILGWRDARRFDDTVRADVDSVDVNSARSEAVDHNFRLSSDSVSLRTVIGVGLAAHNVRYLQSRLVLLCWR
jgi:hypothetical protein